MLSPIKEFKRIYHKDIQLYTMIIIFHMIRKTLLNEPRAMGDTSVSKGTLLMILCILLNFWIVNKNYKYIKNAIRGSQLFLIYIFVCALSFTWAIVPAFGTVMLKDVELLSSFLSIAVVLYQIKDKNKAMLYIVYIMTLSALLGLLNSIKTGELHTNAYTLSAGMGVLMILGVKKYLIGIKSLRLMLCINAIALILGTSSASYISFLIGLVYFMCLGQRGINLKKFIITSILVLILYHFAKSIIYSLIFYGHSEESIKGGTGRYEMWEMFIDSWQKSPILGYGYIIGERSFDIITGKSAVIFSAHNGYLSVLIGTGLLGMAFFGSYLIKSITKCFKQCLSPSNGKEYTILACPLIMLLINNFFYPAFGSDWNYTFPPVILLFLMIHQLKYKTNQKE